MERQPMYNAKMSRSFLCNGIPLGSCREHLGYFAFLFIALACLDQKDFCMLD